MKVGTNKARLRNNLIRFGHSEKEASKCVIMLYTLESLYGDHIKFTINSINYPTERYDHTNIHYQMFLPYPMISNYIFTVFDQGAGIIDDGDTWYVGNFQGDTGDESWLEEVKGAADYYSSSYY